MAKAHRICSIPDCNKRAAGRGLCDTHYRRVKRAEDRAAGIVRVSSEPCTVQGCDKPRYCLGLCAAHYTRQIRHGSPTGGTTGKGEPLEWLYAHVSHEGDDCLTWPYAKGSDGAGVVTYDGRQQSAAAVMCLLAHGEPPTPLHEAAHNCGKGHQACINPGHLRWATRSENHADKHIHGTALCGERHPWARVTEDDVRFMRSMKGRMPVPEMAKRFGIGRAAVYAILSGKNWPHVS